MDLKDRLIKEAFDQPAHAVAGALIAGVSVWAGLEPWHGLSAAVLLAYGRELWQRNWSVAKLMHSVWAHVDVLFFALGAIAAWVWLPHF